MPVKNWILFGLLFSLLPAHAAEAEDPSLEVIEMLGEFDEEVVDLEIAMSEVNIKTGEKDALPMEVKDAE
jgi:hypothetical protein